MATQSIEGASVPKDATVDSRPDLFGVRGQLRPDGDGGILSRMAFDRPEYANPDASQVNSGFYVVDRGLPWHVTLARALGERELMEGQSGLLTRSAAMKASGGDFEVAKVPIAVADSGIIIPNQWATIRTDTGAPLGVVGRAYKVLQNDTVAGFCDALVDSGEAKYETGGVMRNGAMFFLSMELGHLDITVPGDKSGLKTYLLAMTSHDGSHPAAFYIVQVRVVCKNTSDLAKKGALTRYSIRHSGTVDGKLVEARRALDIAFRDTETVKALTTQLALTKVVDQQVADIFARVWPVTADQTDEGNEKASRNADRAFALYQESPNLDGIRGTGWGAYNAVTEYVDHGVKYFGRGATSDASEGKAGNLLYGTGHEAKHAALTELLAVK